METAARYLLLEGDIPSGHVVAVGFVFDAGTRSKNEASPHAYSTSDSLSVFLGASSERP